MKLNVKSNEMKKFLVSEYIFDQPVKKYGEIKYIEVTGFNGGDYKAAIFDEKGREISDKDVWEKVEEALKDHRREEQKAKEAKRNK